jgi:hypothetical protein
MRNLARIILYISITISIAILLPLSAEGQQLIIEDRTAKDIINYSSGMNAYYHIKYISQFYRTGSNEGYQKAAEYVAAMAKEYGLKEVRIEKYPYDGKTSYFSWKTDLQWFPYQAELWMIEPEHKLITSFADTPLSLGVNSQSTDVTAELIFVSDLDSPESYTDLDLKGKIILSSSSPNRKTMEAIINEKGALGFISFHTLPSFDYNRKPYDFPDQVGWTGITQSKHATFLFCISYNEGLKLKQKLHSGQKIKLRAYVKAEIKAANIQVVSGIIPGSALPHEEIIFIAHLDHYKPGCNDNASGSAAILEVAHTLLRMIHENRISPPRRTIRFIWTDEYSGTIAWLARHIDEEVKRISVFNMDMVGEDQYLTNSVLNICQTPYSLPSYLNDVVANIVQVTLNYNEIRHPPKDDFQILSPNGSKRRLLARITPYSFGSDHDMFVDQTIGIPAVAFNNWPDDFYHTNEDTIDKVDPTMLRRVIFMGSAAANFIAWADSEDALKLAAIVAGESQVRLAKESKKALDMMSRNNKESFKKHYKEAINVLQQAALREKEAINSVSQFSGGSNLAQEFIETSKKKIEEEAIALQRGIADFYRILCNRYQLSVTLPALSDKEEELRTLVPFRNLEFRGMLSMNYVSQKAGEDPLFQHYMSLFNVWLSGQSDFLKAYSLPIEMLNFADGKRSLLEIRNAVSAEYDPIDIKIVHAYFRLLEKAGVISFSEVQQ